MVTSIQISEDLQSQLAKRKLFDRESYEEVIWDLLEDSLELSEETKRNIEISKKQISEGKTVSLDEVRKRLKI